MIETFQLMRYFDALVSPMAVFAAGHRTMYKTDMHKFDVLFRRLFRTVVRLPAGMDWTRPWDETLHDWNGRVDVVSNIGVYLIICFPWKTKGG